MTREDFQQLRQRVKQHPKRIVRFEIGAPLDAAIAVSTPGIYLSGYTYYKPYSDRGIYLLDDSLEAYFPPPAYRDVTTWPFGGGSSFSSDVTNGPIQLVYGLGNNPIVFPEGWRITGEFVAAHITGMEAWTYLAPMPLYDALDQLRGMIRTIEQAGWHSTHENFVTIEEAAVRLRAEEISGVPSKGYGVGSFRNTNNTAGCGFDIKRVYGEGQPPSSWAYGCSVGFFALTPLRRKLNAIFETARKKLRFKNYDAEIRRQHPQFAQGLKIEEWTSPDPTVTASVELYDYLHKIRAAGLPRGLDSRWVHYRSGK